MKRCCKWILAGFVAATSPALLWAGGALDALRREGPPEAAETPAVGAARLMMSADTFAPAAAPNVEEIVDSANDPVHARIAAALGISYPCRVKKVHHGKAICPTDRLTFGDGRTEASVVLKRFDTPIFWQKWQASLPYLPFVRVLHDSESMFRNELAMNAAFRKAGLKTLEIVELFPERRILATRFLDGETADRTVARAAGGDDGALAPLARLGEELAAAHRHGLFVADLNPNNVVFAGNDVVWSDLDQSATDGPLSWDILKFLQDMPMYAGAASNTTPERWALIARSFLSGYLGNGGDPRIVRDALNPVYLKNYSRFRMDPAAFHAIRDEIRAAGRSR